MLDDLEIKDFELVGAEKAVLESFDNIHGLSSNQPDKGGYLFEYVKEYGGLSTVQWPKAYPPEIKIRLIPFAPLNSQAVPSASMQIETPGVQATQPIMYSQMGDREKNRYPGNGARGGIFQLDQPANHCGNPKRTASSLQPKSSRI